MIYEVRLSESVKIDLVRLAKSEPKAFAKASRFIEELRTHPKTGTVHPEPLKGQPSNRWSREITKKQRLSTVSSKPRCTWTSLPPTDTTTTNNFQKKSKFTQ